MSFFLTLRLHLNEADEVSMLKGGATTFMWRIGAGGIWMWCRRLERGLLFQQKGLLYSEVLM